MNFGALTHFATVHWKDAVEIALLAVAIYYTWKFFRGTPGANVLVGLVVIFLGATMLSQLLGFTVIGAIFESLSKVLVIALVIIFQPELRRGLAALGATRLFFGAQQSRESLDLLREMTFDLANRQLGALIAIERGQNIESFAESGVKIDCALSSEVVVSLFSQRRPCTTAASSLAMTASFPRRAFFPSPSGPISTAPSASGTARPSGSRRRATPSSSWSRRRRAWFPFVTGG